MHLARTFDLVEREKGKIKVTSMLCNMFRRCAEAIITPASSFSPLSFYGVTLASY